MTAPDMITEYGANAANFPLEDGFLTLGGRRLADIANETDTPFYVYDSGLIKKRVADVRHATGQMVSVHYAIKANPFPDLVKLMACLVDGLDVASAGELSLALDAGMDPQKISFAGPGKRDEELLAAMKAGVLINIESPGELQRLDTMAKREGHIPRVALRVNPDFTLKRAGMIMGGGPRPFGIDAELVPDILKNWPRNLKFEGFHIFSGSQILDAEILIKVHEETLSLAARLAKYAPVPLKTLNLGGGYGIPYVKGDRPLDLETLGHGLQQALKERDSCLQDTECLLELGRFLVGEAGLYVTRVVDRKVSRGTTYLVTDGGMHHHLALSGNFGQAVRRNFPIMIDGKSLGSTPETVNIVGPLCTPLDRLADKMTLPQADVGDLVVVFQSGAYGASASPVNFLGHPEPREILL